MRSVLAIRLMRSFWFAETSRPVPPIVKTKTNPDYLEPNHSSDTMVRRSAHGRAWLLSALLVLLAAFVVVDSGIQDFFTPVDPVALSYGTVLLNLNALSIMFLALNRLSAMSAAVHAELKLGLPHNTPAPLILNDAQPPVQLQGPPAQLSALLSILLCALSFDHARCR